MEFPPRLYLIGAQKAGTTELASLLAQHPSIVLSEPKEPHFFTSNFEKGWDWYRSCFKAPGAWLLDASTSYSYARLARHGAAAARAPNVYAGVPQRIREHVRDPRFIYIMRDPVARTYSSYWHSVRAGNETRDFSRAIREDSYYVRGSFYHDQVALYLECFDRSAFRFIFFEEFIRTAEETTRGCFEFLGLETEVPLKSGLARHESYTLPPMLAKIRNNRASDLLIQGILELMPQSLRSTTKQKVIRRIPAMSEADRDFLQDMFREPNQQLRELLGHPIPFWTQD